MMKNLIFRIQWFSFVRIVTLPILSAYPKIKITAKWQIVGDDSDSPQVCFMMPIKIVGDTLFRQWQKDDWEGLNDVFQHL